MQWYGLYIDGELQYIRKWHGTPDVRDFGIAETYLSTYEVKELPLINNMELCAMIFSK
jgi:hypothetical protein